MENATVWITIAVYVAVMMIIGIVSGRKSKSIADLTVGGRNAGAWLSALSYGTAYFSAVMFVGYAGGTGLNYGLWGIAAGIGNAVFGSWLAWRVLARRTRDVSNRLKIKTMPQFFELRYNSRAMKIFACMVIFIFMIPYSASVYKGLASVAEVLLGIDDKICMIIIAVLAAVLLLLGGYLVQARADFVQGIVMMFGITLLIIFVIRCDRVGGIEGLREYAHSAQGLPKLGVKAAASLIATVLMTSFGTWGLPQMIQKYFGIKDDKQAKRGIVISTFFALLVAGGGYFIGSLCHRFFTADEIASFKKPVQDYIVPNMLKVANLPNILLGIVLVLLIAASVSTLCSITLTASSTFSHGLCKECAEARDEREKSYRAHENSLRCFHYLLLCRRQHRHAHTRHDELLMGNYFRLFPCTVCCCAVLEAHEQAGGMGGDDRRLLRCDNSRNLQAAHSVRTRKCHSGISRGFRSAFRVHSYAPFPRALLHRQRDNGQRG